MHDQSTAVVVATPTTPAPLITTADELAAAFLAGYGVSTAKSYANDLRQWGRWLDGLGVAVLDAQRLHVDAWVRASEDQGIADSTIARRLSTLTGFYNYGVDAGLITRSPMQRVRRPRVSDESPRLGVDRQGMRTLLDTAEADGARSHALVALLGLNGLRVSEALAITLDDLGVERGHRVVKVVRKGRKAALVPLAPRTAAAVDALMAQHAERDGESKWLFISRSGRRLDRHNAWKIVRRLADTAGLEDRSPHDLRHGFVTAALDAGVALRDVQAAAGHADPRTTMRYDRDRYNLDRAATYAVAAYVA